MCRRPCPACARCVPWACRPAARRSSRRLAAGAAEASLSAQRWEAAYEPAVGFTLSAATALTLGVGGWLVWQGELTVGQLTSFSLYLGQLIWPMFAAGWVLSLVQRGKAAWGRLQPVLDAPLSVDDHGSVRQVTPGPLVAQGLRFHYPGQARPALDGVSFELPAGRTLGLVGPDRRRQVHLAAAVAAPSRAAGRQLCAGPASICGTTPWPPCAPASPGCRRKPSCSRRRSPRTWRWRGPGATREQIVQAAQLAAVHEDILRLPQGYDTPVGERGVTLSGGQRQRVALARALLTDAPLLLLDDTLSAVDTDTEARILAHLRRSRAGRTTVIVSHRLSAVVDADRIVVLREGHVAEQGDHAALLAANGWYARQWRYQQLEASLDAS